jgi:hypothetical protein
MPYGLLAQPTFRPNYLKFTKEYSMGVTVNEKDHFKARLNERVLELNADIINQDQNRQRELTKAAVELAEQHYGIGDQLAELQKWERRARRVRRRIDRMQTEIVAHVRGLRPEHVQIASSRNSSYGYYPRNSAPVPTLPDPFNDSDFARYPGDSGDIIRAHAKEEFRRMAREHAVGKQLEKLREKSQMFQDRLVAAASHIQLQTTWKEVTEEFNILMAESQERQPRKVATARNADKPQKAKK